MNPDPVLIRIYRWAGRWGPFRIKVPCGECRLTADIVADVLAKELDGIPVQVETDDWLSRWWQPLRRGGWHAPIVMVDGRVISQGVALNRGTLVAAVAAAWAQRAPVQGTVVFSKRGCPHCERALGLLEERGIPFHKRDVVRSPRALAEMLARVKPRIGPRTPVTVPQIWLDGNYVGGAEELTRILEKRIEPFSVDGLLPHPGGGN